MTSNTSDQGECGARLKGLRKSAGLSITELASQLGMHPNTLKSYEAGLSEIGVGTLLALRSKGWDWVYVIEGRAGSDWAGEHLDWIALSQMARELEKLIASNPAQISEKMHAGLLQQSYRLYGAEATRKMPAPVYVAKRTRSA